MKPVHIHHQKGAVGIPERDALRLVVGDQPQSHQLLCCGQLCPAGDNAEVVLTACKQTHKIP